MNEKDLITLDHDNAFTTSLIVAEKFGKRHKNVLRDIENLKNDLAEIEGDRLNLEPTSYLDNLECSEAFNGLNFEAVNYLDAKGESRQMFQIRRDGFAFLAMGFTGKPSFIGQPVIPGLDTFVN